MQPQLPDDLIDILIKYDGRISITEKSLTNDAVPIGAEFNWPASNTILPFNYIPSDGRALDRIAYASLFSLIGTAYGVGDGVTTFNIPNRSTSTFIGTPEAWIVVGSGGTAPAFQNSWANTSTPTYGSLSYRKISNGNVEITGTITGTSGAVIFTLPANYRPTAAKYFPVLTDGGVAGSYLEIDTTGNVLGTRTGTNLYMNNIYFDSGVLPTTSSAANFVLKVL